MKKHDLKKLALMGLAAGLTVLGTASAAPQNQQQNPAQNRQANQPNRLEGWRAHIDSPIPGYTKARQLAEMHEEDNQNGNGTKPTNGNGNGKKQTYGNQNRLIADNEQDGTQNGNGKKPTNGNGNGSENGNAKKMNNGHGSGQRSACQGKGGCGS